MRRFDYPTTPDRPPVADEPSWSDAWTGLVVVVALPLAAFAIGTHPMLAVGIVAGLLLRRSLRLAGSAGRASVAEVRKTLGRRRDVSLHQPTRTCENEG